MLVEQFLHIMLNQNDPRFFVFSAANIYIYLHYAILGKVENMGEKLYKRLQSHLYTKSPRRL